jgi:hypothetical protein
LRIMSCEGRMQTDVLCSVLLLFTPALVPIQVPSNRVISHPLPKMQIIVTTPSSSTAYAVEGSTTVTDLKSMIENQEFIPEHLIRLVAGDMDLTDGTLASFGLEDDDEVAMLLDVEGGMRAKWRKKRMRRLRRKRRKMRQRAR